MASPRHISHPVLYLDFDGVLHPDAAYWYRRRGIVLCSPGRKLFDAAPPLVAELARHPDVRVVLSTSWVRVLSFSVALARLPPRLADRVIGATWHSHMHREWWDGLTRYQQIAAHATRHGVRNWVAIDDDAEGWPAEHLGHLVHTDSDTGIAAPDLALLTAAFKRWSLNSN